MSKLSKPSTLTLRSFFTPTTVLPTRMILDLAMRHGASPAQTQAEGLARRVVARVEGRMGKVKVINPLISMIEWGDAH